MQRRTFLALLASLPVIAQASETLADLQAEAARRRLVFLESLRKMALTQPKAIYFNPADPVIGRANARRTVLVFSDFNCPYCRKIDPILQQVAKDWPEVRFVLKWQTMMSDSSALAASYALRVWQAERGKYLQVQHALLRGSLPLTQNEIAAIGQQSQTQHLINGAALPALSASVSLGQQLRVFATPSMLIGNQMMSGMTDAATLKATIMQWPMS